MTQPTTIGGIVAVLAYVREHAEGSEFLTADDRWELLVSIEMALRQIADMEPIETEAA
jgi:hypothetical protein